MSNLELGDEVSFSWNQIKNDGDTTWKVYTKYLQRNPNNQGNSVEKSTTITIWK